MQFNLQWKISRFFLTVNRPIALYFFVFFRFFVVFLDTINLLRCEMEPEYLQKNNCSIHNKVNENNFWIVVDAHLSSDHSKTYALGIAFVASFVLSLSGVMLLAIREFIQMIMNFKTYITSFENLMETLIVVLTLLNMILMFCNKDLAIHFGAWAVFFGWWELTLLLGRIPTIGILIYLSLDVLKTVIVFFILFLPGCRIFQCRTFQP